MKEDENGNLVLDDGTVIPEHLRTRAEVYSRCVGYLRPVEAWNAGKQAEFGDRRVFKVDTLIANATTASEATEDKQATEPEAEKNKTPMLGEVFLELYNNHRCYAGEHE